MLRVTVEMIPFGIENHPRRRILRECDISNEGGSNCIADYSAKFYCCRVHQSSETGWRKVRSKWRTAKIFNGPRKQRSAWRLVHEAIGNVLGLVNGRQRVEELEVALRSVVTEAKELETEMVARSYSPTPEGNNEVIAQAEKVLNAKPRRMT